MFIENAVFINSEYEVFLLNQYDDANVLCTPMPGILLTLHNLEFYHKVVIFFPVAYQMCTKFNLFSTVVLANFVRCRVYNFFFLFDLLCK